MSTKTSIKRIALVAVAALTLGTVTTVAANAVADSASGTISTNQSNFTVSGAGSKTFTLTVSGVKSNGSANDAVINLAATGGATLASTSGSGTNATAAYAAGVLTITPNQGNVTSWSYSRVVTINYAAASSVFTATAASGYTTLPTAATFSITYTAGFGGATPGVGESPLTVETGSTSQVYVSGKDLVASPYSPASVVLTQQAGAGNFVDLNWNGATTGGSYTATLSAGASFYSATAAGAKCSNPLSSASGASVSVAGSVASIGSGSTVGDDVASANGITQVACSGVFSTNNFDLKVATPTAGTFTLTVSSITAPGGIVTATPVQVITFIVTPVVVTTSYASTVVTLLGGVGGLKAGSGVVYAPATAGTAAATIEAVQYQADGATQVSSLNSKAVTITLTGVGSLSTNPTVAGASTAFIALPAGSGADTGAINVYADGRPGSATITVSIDGVAVKSKTVMFYGAPTKVTATAVYSVGMEKGGTTGSLATYASGAAYDTAVLNPAGTTSNAATGSAIAAKTNDPAVAILVTDALGTAIPVNPAAITVASSNPGIVIPSMDVASFLDSGKGVYSAGDWYVHTTYTTATSAKSGQSATLTYSVLNSTTGAFVSSAPVALTIGGVVAKEVLTLDASSYEPGAPMVLTVTATDAAGNPAYDGQTGPTFTGSKAFGGAFPSAGTYVAGKIANLANKLFAPATAGDFTIFATGTDAAATKLSVTASVGNDTLDAVAEATDAANAATDAANAAAEAADAATAAAQDAQAAVAALATQVASLIASIKAQITSLTNLVIKIQKKVKA